MDKRIRPFEDIAPLNVRLCWLSKYRRGKIKAKYLKIDVKFEFSNFIVWFNRRASHWIDFYDAWTVARSENDVSWYWRWTNCWWKDNFNNGYKISWRALVTRNRSWIFQQKKLEHFYWLVNISDCKDIHFSNSISATEFQIPTEHKRLRIDSAGFIYLENKISATFSCEMHFERFPFDVQVRHII